MDSFGSFTGRTRRRKTSASVRAGDVVARLLITLGGIGTIAAVFGVFVFLVYVVAPLFAPAALEAEPLLALPGPAKTPLHLAADEHQTMAWTLERGGTLRSFRLDQPELLESREMGPLSAASFTRGGEEIALGFADGTLRLARVGFETRFLEPGDVPSNAASGRGRASFEQGVLESTPQGQLRHQRLAVALEEPIDVDPDVASPVVRIDHVIRGDSPVFAVLTGDGKLRLITTTARKNLLTRKVTTSISTTPIPLVLRGEGLPEHVFLTGLGDNVYVVWKDGHLLRYDTRDLSNVALVEELDLVEEPGERLTAATFLLGRATLVTGDSLGRVRAWFRVRPGEGEERTAGDELAVAETLPERVDERLVLAHDFPPFGAAVTRLAASARTRVVAVGLADGRIRLLHATSHKELGEVRAAAGEHGNGPAHRSNRTKTASAPSGANEEERKQASISALALAPKDDGLLVLCGERLLRWQVDAPHPEVTLSALFRPVWYEGYERPIHKWESSSGSQAFEPKLGLVPLVFGTLKATFYSMLFGAPLALLAAIYTSEFLHRRVKSKIKPAVELMASLPSVVLGFVAALLFAPLVEKVVPALLAGLVTVPLVLLAGAYLWQLLPYRAALILERWRFFFILLVLPMGFVAAWLLGPSVERLFFAGDIMSWLDGQRGSGAGGWMLVLLPLAGLGAFALGREVNTWLRRISANWGRGLCALVDLLKFVVGSAAALAVAWGLAWLLAYFGWDPRGSFLGTYDQRNALVVGFVMGFAIIPIIYTLADDALSSVPEHLRSASLGAGATPWQTATRIVIPTAMSGLFSALMIGLGRAVGETMIVLMAAGNTPILDWNIFNGFRTLSANIAVELPEAVVGSTHYRTLFLAALCLFVMTFAVNTLAEMVRLRFRRRAYEL